MLKDPRNFQYQVKLVSDCIEYLNAKKRCVLSAGCGGGKTKMAYNICTTLDKKTLILTHGRVDLRSQWIDGAEENLDFSELSPKIKNLPNAKFHIGLPVWFNNKNTPKNYYGLIIIDEAHERFFVKEIQAIIANHPDAMVLCLTGTPFVFNKYNNENPNDKWPLVSFSIKELREHNIVADLHQEPLPVPNFPYDSSSYGEKRDFFSGLVKTLITRCSSKERKPIDYHGPKFSINAWGWAWENKKKRVFHRLGKMLVKARDIEMAKILGEEFNKDNDLKNKNFYAVVSDYKSDPDFIEFNKFNNDPNCKILIVVERGILGYNNLEIENTIDVSLTQTPHIIMQFAQRGGRINPKEDAEKIFIKVVPAEKESRFQHVMRFTAGLAHPKLYNQFDGDVFKHYLRWFEEKEPKEGAGGSKGSAAGYRYVYPTERDIGLPLLPTFAQHKRICSDGYAKASTNWTQSIERTDEWMNSPEYLKYLEEKKKEEAAIKAGKVKMSKVKARFQ